MAQLDDYPLEFFDIFSPDSTKVQFVMLRKHYELLDFNEKELVLNEPSITVIGIEDDMRHNLFDDI